MLLSHIFGSKTIYRTVPTTLFPRGVQVRMTSTATFRVPSVENESNVGGHYPLQNRLFSSQACDLDIQKLTFYICVALGLSRPILSVLSLLKRH